ncbi:centromere protein J-like isoform X1 [Argiope bruennichi]|uniref:centromere protein J-like isoform X1 n=1 Tax=Argiope bruennichi TaxID=94029 RepID=UPI002494B2DE|nr:centromere protein J-like isoform X1 [Argiope bruennichi]
MADFTNIHKFSDVRAVINHLREWSENQREKFLDKQRAEHRNLLEQSRIKNIEKIKQDLLSENSLGTLAKDRKLLDEIADKNLSESDNTLQDSSVTGHLMGCFSDSSYSSTSLHKSKDDIADVDDVVSNNESNFPSGISLKENEDSSPIAAMPPIRPKQPFLRKRSGLLRYLPKQNTNLTKTKKISSAQNSDVEHQTKPILKLNPAFKINQSDPQKIKNVKFIEHELFVPNKASSDKEEKLYDMPGSSLTLDEDKYIDIGNSEEDCNTLESENSNDDQNNCVERLNMEKKELAEFELLENCAQNSSFNSDSSIVQRVLQGESIQPLYRMRKPSPPVSAGFDFDHSEKLNRDEIPVNSENLNLGNFLEEQRKQRLQDIILDTDLRIASLKKETSSINKDAYEENCVHERCSTPVDLNNKVNGQLSPVVLDSESSTDSSSSSVIFNPAADATSHVKAVTGSDVLNSYENEKTINGFQNNNYGIPKSSYDQNDISEVKAKLCQKMEELEKEIQTYQELISELEKEKKTYQEHNLHLATIRVERDENLKKLQKGWDELQKHKEEEEKKLEDKRRQLKMREETFNRYQKLRRDNPNRKEREELTVLRQEVEKLQEELKRQRIRFTNENKRLKNQLIAAEQERDSLKLENITLEEQCQDLLATLKSRHIKKRPESGKKLAAKRKESPTSKSHLNNNVPLTSSETTAKSHDSENDDKADSNSSKHRVRFNLIPEFDNRQPESLQSNLQTGDGDGANISNAPCNPNEANSESSIINESLKEELPYEELKHDNQIERIYFSGEKEIIKPSGIIKHISADGETITYRYPNGDVKEVYPDSSVICKFITGVIEKRFPGGIEVTEHPNGQIEKRSPGLEEVKFPDGTTQTRYLFPDGSEKIEYNDGTKVTIEADGTEIAQFKNGIKEIRTAKYMRKEYPDGSVKIIYEDGSQETRYSNGRVKKKDKDGRILLDTKILQNEFKLSIQGFTCS